MMWSMMRINLCRFRIIEFRWNLTGDSYLRGNPSPLPSDQCKRWQLFDHYQNGQLAGVYLFLFNLQSFWHDDKLLHWFCMISIFYRRWLSRMIHMKWVSPHFGRSWSTKYSQGGENPLQAQRWYFSNGHASYWQTMFHCWKGLSTLDHLMPYLQLMGPSNSRGKLFSVFVIAHGSPDQSCDSWSWWLSQWCIDRENHNTNILNITSISIYSFVSMDLLGFLRIRSW